MTTLMYGEQPVKKLPSPEVLKAHLSSVVERIAQIDLLLTVSSHRPEQEQELRSELAIHKDTAADLERQLNPPAADAEIARLEAESRKLQADQMARDHAPEPPHVLEERRQNAAKRLKFYSHPGA